MGEIFVCEPEPVPLPVRLLIHVKTRTTVGGTVHLADSHRKTLCGEPSPLVLEDKDSEATCKTCRKAAEGEARSKRIR